MNSQMVSLRKYAIGFWILFIVAFLSIIFIKSSVWAAGENITTPANKTGLAGTPIAITDLQVTGEGNEEVSLVVSVNAGILDVEPNEGVSLEGNDSSAISMRGLRSDVNTVLASLIYTSNGLGEDTVLIDFGTTLTGVILDPDTGRAYTIIENPLNWNDAAIAASELEYGGVSGFLANITSQEEDQFIASKLSDSVWIGANDITTEGDWQWYGGPEVGNSFWAGDYMGSSVDGAYSNWNPSEPNDVSPGEDCAEYIIGEGWNDLPCDIIDKNYIVEFGSGRRLPNPITSSFTITTTGPEISVASCAELQALDANPDNRFASIELTQDIDCSGIENFEPLSWTGPFGGDFDGKEFSISNITIEDVDNLGYGLFRYVEDAHFEDLTIKNIVVMVTEDSGDCGVLAGGAKDTSLTNVHVENATVTCRDDVGGVFGYLEINHNEDIDINNISVVDGEIRADMNDNGDRVGGLFGFVYAFASSTLTIERVYTDIGVLARFQQAGGFFGSVEIMNDVGNGEPTTIFTVRNAYSKGNVSTGRDDHAGGISGDLGVNNGGYDSMVQAIFENIYVSGDVSGDSEVGGFMGDILTLGDDDEQVEFRNAFFSGVVTGYNSDETHALFGDDNFLDGGTLTMDGVYFDQTASGQSLAMYIEDYPGITAVNIDGSQPNYFIGNNTNAPMNAWDFEDIWMTVADSTPIFQTTPEPVDEEPNQESENTPTPQENVNTAPNVNATPNSNTTSENLNTDSTTPLIPRIITPISSTVRRFFSPIINGFNTTSSEIDNGDPITNFYTDLLLNAPSIRSGDNHVESFNTPLTVSPNQTGLLVWDFTSEDSNAINRKLGIAIEIPENIASDTLTFTVELQDEMDVQNIGEEEVKKIGSIFKVTATDSQGNVVTKFNTPITISLFVLENIQGSDKVKVYYLSDGSTEWREVPNPEFSGEYVKFSVDHLTMFGIFEGEEIPAILPAALVDEDITPSRSMGWWWILIIPILVIVFFMLIKKRKKKTPYNFVN